MWQNLIVAVIVAAAVLHFSTKYTPKAWRKRIALALARHGKAGKKAAAFYAPAAGGCGDGCSSCGSCEDDAPPAKDDPRIIKLHVQPRQ